MADWLLGTAILGGPLIISFALFFAMYDKRGNPRRWWA